VQKDQATVRSILERLVEAGLIQAHGIRKGRTYTLSPSVYRDLGQAAQYVRQAGFDPLQQEQMVLSYVDQHGRIRRQDVIELCRLGPDQARRLLQRLVKGGKLVLRGQKKGSHYERP
jgi:ATP-dependent DNA helicase RecG